MKKKLILIDGNSFCYRAFYAIRSLTTSAGEPTNAIYGFVAMLNKLLTEHQPDYLAVTFDLKGPTFRHKRFADYKSQRKPMPDDLSIQLPTIKKIVSAYNIPIFEQEGYEADDIIATLVAKLAGSNALEILIVTGDKDMLQIVAASVKVLNPHKEGMILDEAWVKKRFGVEPVKVIEIMALAGDASDNIPGVPGIGEATAIDLIKKFGTLDQVLANVDAIENKARRTAIKEFVQQAQMSRELAMLDVNVERIAKKDPAALLAELRMRQADSTKLLELFKRLEFKSLMQKVAPKQETVVDYRIVDNATWAQKYLKEISQKDSIAFYLYSTHQEPMLAEILGLALALEKGENLFFSLEHISIEAFKPILEDKGIKKIGHDLKYAKLLLSNYGIALNGLDFDAKIAAYLLRPESLKYELADLTLEYLNCRLEALPVKPGHPIDQETAKSCCECANIILKLSMILRQQLKSKSLLSLFENIELPLIEVLVDMEGEGIALDKDLLLHLSRDFENRLKGLTQDIYEISGESFNINSPKQLSFVLFEKLKLPKVKRTKTGASTDTEVLAKLAKIHPIAGSLLEFREIAKLKSTYLDGMLKLLHHQTGRIHTSFNQTATATGRLSSSHPNLQNIPIKTRLGRKIRQVFVPAEKGNLLLSADYSQIELRILAHLCADRNLISAFKEDLDIHAYTASLIFGESPNKITQQMRDTAKTVNFGIIYGMSAYGLSKDLGISQAQAQEFIQAYFQRYPGVKKYIDTQIEKAKRYGFVTTLLKRRRYIPQIKSVDQNISQFAQRAAINAPVQGSASDLIKAAMIEIQRNLKAKQSNVKMMIQVHDELVFSVPQDELEPAKALIKERMENVFRLKVPLKVSIKSGKNWLEVK